MVEELISGMADLLLTQQQPTLQDIEDIADTILVAVNKKYPNDNVTKQMVVDIVSADRKIYQLVSSVMQDNS